MRKGCIVLLILSLLVVFTVGGVFAQENETQTSEDSNINNVDKAYQCLSDKIEEKGCKNLGLSEKIYSVLATGECKKELLDEARDKKCWPKESCNIETTAQAVWALKSVGENTKEAEDWLLSQRIIPTDLDWYLQVDSSKATTCSIKYDGRENSVNILADKTITQSAGNCLTISPDNNYWLKVSPTCYEKEFEISCNESFITTFLFKEKDSKTIHVRNEIKSAAEGGKILEKIESYCFADKSSCNYEGSLWATMVLGEFDYETRAYWSYLITSPKFTKGVFAAPLMYMITGDEEYKAQVLNRQVNGQYWNEAKDRFYDTALALLPFSGKDIPQKEGAIEWLYEIQSEEGCWDGGNVRNNAFILYSLWPRSSGIQIDDNENCEDVGYFCTSSFNCEAGNILTEYDCSGIAKCCRVAPESKTCSSMNGEICGVGEVCSGGEKRFSDDLKYYETCCVGGECKKSEEIGGGDITEEYTCGLNSGICESYGCGEGYIETSMYSCAEGQSCCIRDVVSKPATKIMWWIWVLFFLIVLLVIAIIYREKIKKYILKIRGQDSDDKDKSSSQGRGGPSFPSYPRSTSINRLPQRKIIPKQLPPQQRGPMGSSPKPKTPRELDDVLKKLKEMSN